MKQRALHTVKPLPLPLSPINTRLVIQSLSTPRPLHFYHNVWTGKSISHRMVVTTSVWLIHWHRPTLHLVRPVSPHRWQHFHELIFPLFRTKEPSRNNQLFLVTGNQKSEQVERWWPRIPRGLKGTTKVLVLDSRHRKEWVESWLILSTTNLVVLSRP